MRWGGWAGRLARRGCSGGCRLQVVSILFLAADLANPVGFGCRASGAVLTCAAEDVVLGLAGARVAGADLAVGAAGGGGGASPAVLAEGAQRPVAAGGAGGHTSDAALFGTEALARGDAAGSEDLEDVDLGIGVAGLLAREDGRGQGREKDESLEDGHLEMLLWR